MTTKKSTKKQTKVVATNRPAKRKVITSLAQYEAEAKAAKRTKNDVAKTVNAVEKGNLAEGVNIPTAAKKTPAATARADAANTDKKKRPSGLDAAVTVLAEAGKPMNCGDIVKLMLERGLWSTGGKTPAATIYAAIIREIAVKGTDSRFRKTDRGHFELTEAGKEVK